MRSVGAQTLEFHSRGARPAAPRDHVCTMPRAREGSGVRVSVRGGRLPRGRLGGGAGGRVELPPCLLLLRTACSCHLLPESHRRNQGRACCEASGGGSEGPPPPARDPSSDSEPDGPAPPGAGLGS